jgi:hypothetical protein
MAVACTGYKAYGIDIQEPVTKRALQVFELTLTAAAADVTFDLSDVGGTAWSAIDGDALGLAAKTAFTTVLSKVEKMLSWKCLELEAASIQALADAVGKYVLTLNTAKTMVNIALHAGEGVTGYKFVFVWTLRDEERALRAGF